MTTMPYANQYIYTVTLSGCSTPAKVFVEQRAEAFAVNLALKQTGAPVDMYTVEGGVHGKFTPEQKTAINADLKAFLTGHRLLDRTARLGETCNPTHVP